MTASTLDNLRAHRGAGSRRGVYALLCAGVLAAAVFAAQDTGVWWPGLAGLLGPDIALLLGIGKGLEPGQLHPRAVPLYNVLHSFLPPIALVATTVAGVGDWALVTGFAWMAHIALDRALGYGFRTRDGFQRD